jgi:hypothetical protein
MTGILEVFALFETVSGIGLLTSWRNKHLAHRVNYFHAPQNRKSPLDRLIQAQTGPVVTRQDHLCMKLADGVTQMIRSIVMFDGFRQLLRALALPNSPLRRKLRTKRRLI